MLRALLRRDRAVALAALTAVIVLAWIWLLHGAGLDAPAMEMPGGMRMMMPTEWTVGYAGPYPADVGDHDAGDDAAERSASDPVGRYNCGAAPSRQQCRCDQSIRIRLCLCMVRLQLARYLAAMAPRQRQAAVGSDGKHEYVAHRRAAGRGRDLSMDPIETRLPEPLPRAV